MRREKTGSEERSKNISRKSLAIILSLTLVLGAAVGGTIAWLIDSTEKVENVFTPSNIDVELTETTTDYKMVPGWTIAKDPKVTLKANSEACYLFIKVEKNGGDVTVGETTYSFDDFIAYAIADGWTAGEGTGEGKNGVPEGVYYKKIDVKTTADTTYTVLGAGSFTDTKVTPNATVRWDENQVATKPSVTEQMMEALQEEGAVEPTLSFTAYASQLYKTNKPTGEGVTEAQLAEAQFTAAEAWANIA